MIEYWGWVSDPAAQRDYQDRVTCVSVSNEAINQWEDWQPFESPEGHYGPPVYTIEETEMICRFHDVWNDVAENTPDPMPSLEELLEDGKWRRLIEEAHGAYQLFMKRGKLDENVPLQNTSVNLSTHSRGN
ncbi:hypothetical protein RMSM_05796 [Rhodopirellula maiorica SM1]|uniref:Uncharacterized protein n=1 Tax=Rhodopirellula maiorica SM1 TaxID=1265738 RepID=M5RD28_9BACT|nr:hypothetical protein [Rhodopirellula maiorica]EMI17280.1 hypothetical protein RMSM_05796 [Rhodopirellula maiorica SM1]